MPVHFWAKSTSDDEPGISVFDHMLNVGFVARCLAEATPELLRRLQIDTADASALAALHDLGKISPGFQQKLPAWLRANGLTDTSRQFMWERDLESDHGQVTHAAVQEFLVRNGTSRSSAKHISAVLGGHHGRLKPPNDRGFRPAKAISEKHSGIEWDREREAAARATCDAFGTDLKKLMFDQNSPALWWLAGLTSVSDWVGSDERFFSPAHGLGAQHSFAIARQAVTQVGLVPPEVKPGLSFHDLFHDARQPTTQFRPNAMQLQTASTITSPGVYVIEAPMGTGKTEAALWAAYQLLVDRKARGVYFALPTQATSNRMHLRMSEFVRRIAPTTAGSQLIHANSWLMEHEPGLSPSGSGKQAATDDARVGRNWFASAKRALLAPFGVGTVDQALLGVVAAKHFFVRRYALAGKVVILDEVHSYDVYTGTLIDKLISMLEQLGSTVIVLSATLTGKRRNQIITAAGNNDEEAELSYPLISGRREGTSFRPVAATPPSSHEVDVIFQSLDDAALKAIVLAKNGGSVLWICNTVASAQQQYLRFQAAIDDKSVRLGLLHSRFPFWRREELENEWMERLGKRRATRCGSILVSTQIVEQSVDLDADLLVTELAPTDMLLQRIGRLWRHERSSRAASNPCLVILKETAPLHEFRRMSKSMIVEALGGKARVYSPYVLLRSLAAWSDRQRVKLPNQIRGLIEETYAERDDDPESWQELWNEWFGTDSAKKLIAARNSNPWTVLLEDDEGVQTRLNDLPTISLVLCSRLTKTDADFLDSSQGGFQGDEFRLETAQCVHRNLVRVPAHYFRATTNHGGIARYLQGRHCVGLVRSDGEIIAEELNDSVRLHWSPHLGIIIETTPEKEQT
ncbi:MAG: CRISPR-associated helicase Cas3' [Pirellulales bacterium]